MKTLLLLLLPFVGMCQQDLKIDTTVKYVITSKMFLDYKKECYADSSLHVPDKNDILYISHTGAGTLSERIKPFWVHRQPTFEGFMEYIEKLTSK